MSTIKTLIRIYDDFGPGKPFEDNLRDFELEEFGGNVPNVGDCILDTLSWHPASKSREIDFREPSERRMWEVTHRYFLPESHPKAFNQLGDDGVVEKVRLVYVVLVVKERQVTDIEINLLK